MRDPCIAKGPDGIFHMVWTTSWEGSSIGYASSADLVNWSEQKELRPMAHEPTTRNCWAPELTYDPTHDHFMIYWSSTIPGRYPETDSSSVHGRNHRFYYTLTKDFVTFSPTQLLYDPGFNSIDASIYPDGKRWVMFFKDETRYPEVQKNLKFAFSNALTGPYSKASKPFTHQWVEGPTVIRIGKNWRLYYDEYPKVEGDTFRIRVMESKNLKKWKDLSDQMKIPKSMRHGTIFEVDESVIEGIKKAGKW